MTDCLDTFFVTCMTGDCVYFVHVGEKESLWATHEWSKLENGIINALAMIHVDTIIQ